MAAKRTHELIPFCHPVAIERCDRQHRERDCDHEEERLLCVMDEHGGRHRHLNLRRLLR